MKLKDVNKRQKHVVASTYLLVLLKAYLRILVYVSQAETGRHVLSRHALKRDFHLQCVQSPKEYWWVHFVIQNYLRYSVYGQTVLTAENSGSPLSSPANPTVLTTNLGRWIRFSAPRASHHPQAAFFISPPMTGDWQNPKREEELWRTCTMFFETVTLVQAERRALVRDALVLHGCHSQ